MTIYGYLKMHKIASYNHHQEQYAQIDPFFVILYIDS